MDMVEVGLAAWDLMMFKVRRSLPRVHSLLLTRLPLSPRVLTLSSVPPFADARPDVCRQSHRLPPSRHLPSPRPRVSLLGPRLPTSLRAETQLVRDPARRAPLRPRQGLPSNRVLPLLLVLLASDQRADAGCAGASTVSPVDPLSPLSKRRISELFCVLCIYSPVARTYSLFTVSCVCLTSASNVRLAVDHDRKPSPADRGGGKASRQGAQRAHGDRADEDVRRRPWGGLVGKAEEWGKESEGEGRWNGRGRPVQRLGGDDPGRRRVAGSCAS